MIEGACRCRVITCYRCFLFAAESCAETSIRSSENLTTTKRGVAALTDRVSRMAPDPDNPLGLSASVLEQVDQLCMRFERSWRSGQRPAIEEFLSAGPGEARSALLQELLLLDVDYRKQRGECPVHSDYTNLFQDQAPLLKTVFANSGDTDPAIVGQDSVQSPSEPPSRFGRYRVIERRNQGGFGTLYRARDDELERDVAIKVPHRHLVDRPAAIDLFRREARAVATLSHPAIVPIYDVHFDSHDPASCYVVSEFMPGGDLAAYAEENKLAPDEIARIVQRIADALHFAHGRGFVHRDVKLSNILRDAQGEVYIADFGLALRDEEVGSGHGYAGTPANMSPEQARGDGHLVDGRTDVYGLGVVLYELLTGRRPFETKNVPELLTEIQCREPKPPRQIDDTIPAELERICLKALAKHPVDRYSTALDLARNLDRARRAESHSLLSRPATWLTAAVIVAILLVAWLIPKDTWNEVSGNVHRPSRIRTLAVLPFRPVVKNEDSAYLGLGMADSLITKLSNLRQIVVRPTAAIHEYVDAPGDPVEAGDKLRVDAVLEGTIQQTAGQTRATVRLLRVADGHAIWAETFEEGAVDLFALQDLISTQVARALALQLTAQEQARLERRHTENREAYEAYVKGLYHWNQRARPSGGQLGKAIEFFQKAIEADPLYALAYCGLADTYALLNLWSGKIDETAFPRARAAAKRALELDPDLDQAQATFAMISFYHDWDWQKAEQGFRRAIELNPNYATAHQWYGEFLYFSTRFDEAIAELKKAAELDPLSPVISALQPTPYLWRRDYDRALRELAKAADRTPDSALVYFGFGLCHEQASQFDTALKYYRKQFYLPGQAIVLAKLGQETESRRILAEMHERVPHRSSQYNVALVHLALGEIEQAFDCLNDARKQRDEHMVWLRVDPRLDPIREDPRFVQLLKEVGWTR